MDLESAQQLLLILLVRRKRRNSMKKKKNRRWWVRPVNRNREKNGEFRRLLIELKLHDKEWFFCYTRMTSTLFEDLLSMVGPLLKKSSIRKPISPSQRLAMTLRFLAHGDSYFCIANGYHVGKSTVCNIIREVTEVIWTVLSPVVLESPTENKFRDVAEDYWKIWNMPNCIGSIDGKHIRITAPARSGSLFYNYKNYFSVILLGICDANYNFLYVDIGAYGSVSDGGIFASSEIGNAIINKMLPLPKKQLLPGSNIMMNHFFVADSAFPLTNNIMRPYAGKNLNVVKAVYNYRLSRARRVIENTFGILVARWRIFHRSISAFPKTVDNIIKATVCLHNFIRASLPAQQLYSPPNFIDSDDVLGKWREEVENTIMENCHRLGSNNSTILANQQRDNLAKYFFTSAGFKNGQIEYVKRT